MLTWFFNTETEFGVVLWKSEGVLFWQLQSLDAFHSAVRKQLELHSVCPKQIAYSRLQA